jgi:hypothetical protein
LLHVIVQNTFAATKDSLVRSVYYEPVFKYHLLQPTHNGAVFNNAEESYWPSLILFLAVSLIVLLKVTSPVRTLRVLNAAYSLQIAKQIEREDYSPFKRVSVVLSVVFVISTAFLLFKLNQLYGSVLMGKEGLFQFLFFAMLVVIVYTVKYIVNSIISFLAQTPRLFNEYINNTFIINEAIGVVLLPIVIIAQLSPLHPQWLILPGLLFLCFGYLQRLYRGFVFAGLEEGVGFLQLFIYLCALEILPLLVLIKFVVVNF